MFDNVLYQSAVHLLKDDILKNTLPGSILFAGPASSGKLTAALELARILGCQEKGEWQCNCSSCRKNKVLINQNVIVTGPCDRIIEIKAAADTFLNQIYNNTTHLEASRFLFIRSVRKLTSRFNPVLWEGEDKLSKFSPLLQTIEESLELIRPGKTLPEDEELRELVETIYSACEKLESTYLYDSLPVSQIRNFSAWARLSSSSGKKVLVIENADRMADAARNALLKILEEPPEDTVFVLTTTNRLAVLPTILSRLRTYSFFERSEVQQQQVIDRVFHYIPKASKPLPSTIDQFLQNYLTVTPENIAFYAKKYLKDIASGEIPDAQTLSASCNGFSPRMIFKAFLEQLIVLQKPLSLTARGGECSAQIVRHIHNAWNNVNVYNQNPVNALEELTRNLKQVNYFNGSILKELFADE